MRAKWKPRVPGAAQLAACALALAVPCAIVAQASADVSKSSATGTSPLTTTVTKSQPTVTVTRAKTRFTIRRRTHDALVGRSLIVRGHLLHAGRDAKVLLQRRHRRRWVTVAHNRTGRQGAFKLHFKVTHDGPVALRVKFAGSRTAEPAKARIGRVVGLVHSVASWYYDAGSTACGFHAGYGVASKTLPCGTKVTFVYGGHSVTATVDDRGPYVSGRSFDLNQTTSRALGMYGVATVEASV
jgi:rare lipoprotein A